MTDRQIDISSYNKILGSGGFGLIVYNPVTKNVAKLIYNKKDCITSSIESDYQKMNYEAVENWLKYHSSDQINVPKPHGYRDDELVWNNRIFSCSYIMDLVQPIPGYTYLFHIILKEGYPIGQKGRIADEPISDANPTRGFFAGCEYIQKNILDSTEINTGNIRSCGDLSRYMGLLLGISLFGARMIPIDAEYVLGYKNNKLSVSFIDFGMFKPLNLQTDSVSSVISKLQDIDDYEIYFPDKDMSPELYSEFLLGIEQAAEFYIPKISNSVEREKMIEIYNGFTGRSRDFTGSDTSLGIVNNIEKLTLDNRNFREIIYTGTFSQLVLMSLEPGQEIGEEIHKNVDQFIRIEKGTGIAILSDVRYDISDGFAIVVPAGTKHNIINTSSKNRLKLYTLYSPPEHKINH